MWVRQLRKSSHHSSVTKGNVCNPASDQRERRSPNRAAARNGIQRPNVGDQRERRSPNRAGARTGIQRPNVGDQRERRSPNRAGARTGMKRPNVSANRDPTSERWRPNVSDRQVQRALVRLLSYRLRFGEAGYFHNVAEFRNEGAHEANELSDHNGADEGSFAHAENLPND